MRSSGGPVFAPCVRRPPEPSESAGGAETARPPTGGRQYTACVRPRGKGVRMWRTFGRVCAPPAHADSWVAPRARRCGAFIGGGRCAPTLRCVCSGGQRALRGLAAAALSTPPTGSRTAMRWLLCRGGTGSVLTTRWRESGGGIRKTCALCMQRLPAPTARAGGRRNREAAKRQPYGDAVAGVGRGDGSRPDDAVAKVGRENVPGLAPVAGAHNHVARPPCSNSKGGGLRTTTPSAAAAPQ